MRIAQITDSHLVGPGRLWNEHVDTAAHLRRAVSRLNEIKPDLVIHTGDVADAGDTSAYAEAAEILGMLDAPLRLLPGNHDDRAKLAAAFPAQEWEGAPFLTFAFEAEGLRVIGLDTVIEGDTAGGFCGGRLDALRDALKGERPTVIFAHHPPCPMGLKMMDLFRFHDTEPLRQLLAPRHDVIRYACGHVHADADAHWAGLTVSACPALSIQLPPDQAFEPGAGYMMEPGAIRLHDWVDGALTVKTATLGQHPGPFPLSF